MDNINKEVLNEFFLDKESRDLIKKWKLSNEKDRIKKFQNSQITQEEYDEIKELVDTMRKEDVSYGDYKKAFTKFCRFIHTIPTGVIIKTIDLKSNKDNTYTLYVEYSENTKKITLPAGTKLYHMSQTKGITSLLPFFRGKAAKGYLYDKPRIYFTIRKEMPKFLADYKMSEKVHTYVCKKDITDVYVDPLVPSNVQGAVYIETNSSIPVEEVGLKKDDDKTEVKEEGFEFDSFFDFIQESGLVLAEDQSVETLTEEFTTSIEEKASGIINEGKLGDLYAKLKQKTKKNAVKFQNDSNKSSKVNLSEEEIKEAKDKIYKDLCDIIKEYNNDENTKKQIKSIIEKNPDDFKDIKGLPKFSCTVFEDYPEYVIYEVLKGYSQDVRSDLSDIVFDISKDLESANDYACTDIGDGDEGCIYVSIYKPTTNSVK